LKYLKRTARIEKQQTYLIKIGNNSINSLHSSNTCIGGNNTCPNWQKPVGLYEPRNWGVRRRFPYITSYQKK